MLFLYGAYGCKNYGDDLICKGALTLYPDANIFALYTNPDIELNEKNKVYFSEEKSENVINVLKENINNNPSLKFAGGGLFWSREHIKIMFDITTFCFENNIPVSMERVGLHGAQYYPEKSLGLLDMMESISVRDISSRDLILGMGLNIHTPVFIEPCFTHLLPKLDLIKDREKTCFLNLNLWLKYDYDKTSQLIKKLLLKFDNIQFVYFIQTKHIKELHSELVIANKLISDIEGLTLLNADSAEEYYSNFQNATMVISSGYHTALLPIINNIPVFQIAQGVDNQTKYLAVAKESSIDYYVQSVYQEFAVEKIFDRLCDFIVNNNVV